VHGPHFRFAAFRHWLLLLLPLLLLLLLLVLLLGAITCSRLASFLGSG
jgi:hypothetical protein